MKTIRVVILVLIIGSPLITSAQEIPKFVYCEILGTEKLLSTKVNITVDFGQRMKVFADNRMRDETGKPLVFNTMIDALNFMGKQGWEFTQAYAVTISNVNVYHYLMKKPFAELDSETKTEFLKN